MRVSHLIEQIAIVLIESSSTLLVANLLQHCSIFLQRGLQAGILLSQNSLLSGGIVLLLFTRLELGLSLFDFLLDVREEQVLI